MARMFGRWAGVRSSPCKAGGCRLRRRPAARRAAMHAGPWPLWRPLQGAPAGGACSPRRRWGSRCARQSCSSSQPTTPAAVGEVGWGEHGGVDLLGGRGGKAEAAPRQHTPSSICRPAPHPARPIGHPAGPPPQTGHPPSPPRPPCPQSCHTGTAAARPAAPAAWRTRWPPPRRSSARAAPGREGGERAVSRWWANQQLDLPNRASSGQPPTHRR